MRYLVTAMMLAWAACQPAIAQTRSLRAASLQRSIKPSDVSSMEQTVCVRLCDGYFWPLRFGASARTVLSDDRRCQESCSTPTRLFFRDTLDSPAEEMRDVAGQSYAALPQAFVYRRTLIAGCSCRPMPWSEAERDRHDGYALAEADLAAAQTDLVNAAPVEPTQSVPPGGMGPAEAAAVAAFRPLGGQPRAGRIARGYPRLVGHTALPRPTRARFDQRRAPRPQFAGAGLPWWLGG